MIARSGSLIHFYDSASPQNIPSGSYAAVELTNFPWDQEDIDRMHRIFRFVASGTPSFWMHKARGVDFEPGGDSLQQVIDACIARHTYKFDDFTVYGDENHMNNVNGDGTGGSLPAVLRQHAPGRPFRLWVAAWDGDPTARPVIDGVPAWAKQFQGGVRAPYDVSALYGVNDFQHP